MRNLIVFSILVFAAAGVSAQTKKPPTTKPAPQGTGTPSATTPSGSMLPDMPSLPSTTAAETPAAKPVDTPAPVKEMPKEKPSKKSSESDNLFGLNVAGGFPYMTQFGLIFVHSSRWFSFELLRGSTSVRQGDAGLALIKNEAALRWHVFAGSFYLGVAYGQQNLALDGKKTISGQEVQLRAELQTTVMTPHLGWMWGMADGGFFAGMDFGLQNNSGARPGLTTNAPAPLLTLPEYISFYNESTTAAEKFGTGSLPVFSLLRIGFLF